MFDARAVMHQTWRHLLFLHWEVPAEPLQRALPPGLSIDTFEGRAFVGLVPFTIEGLRAVFAPPLPWLSRFHEVNVRTYVHRNGQDHGVWFFSLDASSPMAVVAARAWYKLPYFRSRIELVAAGDGSPAIDYSARRADRRGAMPANLRVRYGPASGLATEAVAGTLEHFLIERYLLYTADKGGRLYRARVHHQPYRLRRAEAALLEESLVRAAGITRPGTEPLAHCATDVRVDVYRLERL